MGRSDALVWNAERLRSAAEAAGIGLWSWNVDTDAIAMDARSHTLWGVPRDGPFTFADLSVRIVPPDLERVKSALQATRTAPGPYQIDFRILHPDGIRWVSARGRGARMHVIGAEEEFRGLKVGSHRDASWGFLRDMRDLGRRAADRWLGSDLASVGVRSTMDLCGYAGSVLDPIVAAAPLAVS